MGVHTRVYTHVCICWGYVYMYVDVYVHTHTHASAADLIVLHAFSRFSLCLYVGAS